MVVKTFRDMRAYASAVGNLNNVALVPEVQEALLAWVKAKVGATAYGVLIGGIAMSFYARPRYTTDVDLLFISPVTIPDHVDGFKRHRAGAYQDNKHHVEVELTTSNSFPTLPQAIVYKVFNTCVIHQGIRVASREGMIALKLCGAETPKREHKDLADVVALLEGHLDIDMSGWALTASQLVTLAKCKSKLA